MSLRKLGLLCPQLKRQTWRHHPAPQPWVSMLRSKGQSSKLTLRREASLPQGHTARGTVSASAGGDTLPCLTVWRSGPTHRTCTEVALQGWARPRARRRFQKPQLTEQLPLGPLPPPAPPPVI